MTTYVSYQCSICRRTKDIIKDNLRATPNQCTITKGCAGSLYKIGETTNASPVLPVPGLTNWYPRGETVTARAEAIAEEKVSLSCSNTGVLTLALLLTDAEAASNPSVKFVATQQLSADVPFTEYVYNLVAGTQIISGKDSLGKNLRFDQNAIDNNQIQVLVNGVARVQGDDPQDYVATPNTITFNQSLDSGTVVSVSVFGTAPTIQQTLTFIANNTFIASDSSGSWGNIRWVDEYDPDTGELRSTGNKKWWLYSCTSITGLSAFSLLRVSAIKDSSETTTLIPGDIGEFDAARFLLASPPHDSTDRYLNFYVDLNTLSEGYILSTEITSVTELFASTSALVNIYPPFQLIFAEDPNDSSYVIPDTFPKNSALSSDTPQERLVATRILGPL